MGDIDIAISKIKHLKRPNDFYAATKASLTSLLGYDNM